MLGKPEGPSQAQLADNRVSQRNGPLATFENFSLHQRSSAGPMSLSLTALTPSSRPARRTARCSARPDRVVFRTRARRSLDWRVVLVAGISGSMEAFDTGPAPATLRGVRVAVVSDVHGNLAALEAVVADLRLTGPDLVLQAGDAAVLGPRPAEVVDRLRELAWPALVGNTDQMLWEPEAQVEQERRAPRLRSWLGVLFGVLGPWAAERLGDQRLAWLRSLPEERRAGGVRVVHASPGDLWRAPAPEAADAELAATYGGQEAVIAVYGHVHRPFVRELPGLIVANCGSVGLPPSDAKCDRDIVHFPLHELVEAPHFFQGVDHARRELARHL